MKLLTQTLILVFLTSSSTSCQTTNPKNKIISDKNKCYDLRLSSLKESNLYKEVMTAFNDTFPILKTVKKNFGAPEIVTTKVDEALFFKKDSSECMLIVLRKLQAYDFIFGSARMVRCIKQNKNWKFEISMTFDFDKDYFKLYKENNFENISKLARYSALTEGDIKSEGCEIDDDYWFVYLKK
ncbi:MAG: hypothetical protein JNK14_19145 [Chitinophagaceae bacterium]|nr:hypothetical protein [Chitinophagaceae bacterium]